MKLGLFIADVGNEAFDHNVEECGLLITREGGQSCRDVLITYSVGKVWQNLEVLCSQAGITRH